jgi:hypothetical protein
MVFHPHGWIKNDQVIEFIDHAVAKHGKKVKFLTFKEAQQRLDKGLFEGSSLRGLQTTPRVRVEVGGRSAGFAAVTVDRYEGNTLHSTTRIWGGFENPNRWKSHTLKVAMPGTESGPYSRWLWAPDPRSDLLVIREAGENYVVITPDDERLPFRLPLGAILADRKGSDAGLRFVDLDGDGKLDVIFSNEKGYGIYLFKDMKDGWSRKVMAGKAGDKGALPMISRNGTNNGFWVHSGSLWWSNEDTVLLKDHVDRRSIKELLDRVNAK